MTVTPQTFRQRAQGALSLNIAFIGVVNGLFTALHELGEASTTALAAASKMDAGYLQRWCEAAFAFAWLDERNGRWSLTESGAAMRPEAPDTLMALAVGSVLSAHMAERAAGLMRSGERPGEKVLGERETILPWFGAMLEANFRKTFEETICPAVPIFAEVDARGGLAVDLGCGNGWYLRALTQRCGHLRGLGLDGFDENVVQARAKAAAAGLGERLRFAQGDIKTFHLDEAADLIAMNRALHHVWDEKETVFRILHDQLKPGGAVVIWEPAWPDDVHTLRDPALRGMAFQNLTEYVQGNHFLKPEEIAAQFAVAGMGSEIYRFGNDAVIVGRRAR